jgi:hypothetical protein
LTGLKSSNNMKKTLTILFAVIAILFSSCGADVHKQYAKCGTKLAKKKHEYYNSVQHK